jgi:hypothetical protein
MNMAQSINAIRDADPGSVRSEVDPHDQLSMRAAQLSALLHTLLGEGHEHFQGLNKELQNNVLWLASSLADEIDEIAKSCFVTLTTDN